MPSIIEGPADWRGPDLAERDDWVTRLSDDQKAELRRATDAVAARGLALQEISAGDFPLPAFGPALLAAREAIERGPGLHLFRGVPVDAPVEDLRKMYWGIGKHLGTPVSQSKRGDVLGDVRDIGTDLKGREGRGYTSSAELEFHTDSADVSALLFIKTARSGGLSRFVSSVAIHNEIARTRPDLLALLYEPYVWSRQGQEREGEPPVYEQPIFGIEQGQFASRYIRTHIFSAQRHHGVPTMSDAQREALALIDRLADDPAFCLDMMLEPGDLVFLNSHVTYHSRTEFEDHDEPERKRHLLRMWLSVPNSRPLPEGWRTIYRDLAPGAVRGGFPGHSEQAVYETA